MDMYFAACELRDKPQMKDKPIAVGDYSMVQTANYEARKYGVKAAMPGFLAKQMCPNLIFIKSDKGKYKRITENELLPILRKYDSKLSTLGLDEANLDVTNYLEANGQTS